MGHFHICFDPELYNFCYSSRDHAFWGMQKNRGTRVPVGCCEQRLGEPQKSLRSVTPAGTQGLPTGPLQRPAPPAPSVLSSYLSCSRAHSPHPYFLLLFLMTAELPPPWTCVLCGSPLRSAASRPSCTVSCHIRRSWARSILPATTSSRVTLHSLHALWRASSLKLLCTHYPMAQVRNDHIYAFISWFVSHPPMKQWPLL